MPTWVQVVIAAAAVVTSLGVLIQKVIRPLLHGANRAEEMYRMQVQFMAVFSDAPELLKVLREMSLQFQTDHGSSLRDVVNDISDAAKDALAAATALAAKVEEDRRILAVQVEAKKEVDTLDRESMRRMDITINRLERIVEGNAAGLVRMEAGAAVVADDLASAGERADASSGGDGSAADAAMKSPESDA